MNIYAVYIYLIIRCWYMADIGAINFISLKQFGSKQRITSLNDSEDFVEAHFFSIFILDPTSPLSMEYDHIQIC